MQARNTVLLAVATFLALVLVALVLGHRERGVIDEDERASSYVSSSGGTSALYEALPALAVRVGRLRERHRVLPAEEPGVRAMVLVLSPASPLAGSDVQGLLDYVTRPRGGGDILVAGMRSLPLLQCLGYGVRPLLLDSLATTPGVPGSTSRPYFAHAVLLPLRTRPDSASPFGLRRTACPAMSIRAIDTLLTTERGPVAVRLESASGNAAVVVADAGLFRNRALRDTQAGELVLGWLARGHDRVVFDEYHQGFGPSTSLARALIGWSLRSPLGWGVWQMAVVGLLALLAAGVRFGPATRPGGYRRRASLEHVRALATAMAASRGHDVAIASLLRGLRRRLTPIGRRAAGGGARDAGREWLDGIHRRTLEPSAQRAVQTLKELTTPGQDEGAVLRAAIAVEDVWDTLRHSTPTTWRR